MPEQHSWPVCGEKFIPSELQFVSGQFDGFVGGPLHSASGPPQSSGEHTDDHGCKRGDKSEIAKGFPDLPERDQTNVIRGAIILCAISSVLAYLVVNRKSV
jgi:hypothetical protein